MHHWPGLGKQHPVAIKACQIPSLGLSLGMQMVTAYSFKCTYDVSVFPSTCSVSFKRVVHPTAVLAHPCLVLFHSPRGTLQLMVRQAPE